MLTVTPRTDSDTHAASLTGSLGPAGQRLCRHLWAENAIILKRPIIVCMSVWQAGLIGLQGSQKLEFTCWTDSETLFMMHNNQKAPLLSVSYLIHFSQMKFVFQQHF